ncbi:MAG TPA: signal peptidase I [Nitrospiraceae bacterium]|nr:signal peptidase I [Nitrospiraceae bacterium]
MIKKKSKFREYTEAIIIALLLALLIRTFVIQAFKIPSGSMLPTLTIGDHLLTNKFIYGIRIPFVSGRFLVFKEPQRGDIIVFEYAEDPKRDFIKRVVAVGGDKIEIKNKMVYVNDKPINEPYVIHKDRGIEMGTRDNLNRRIVPEGKFFVMGDNRDQSHDSRFWGYVDFNSIKGKAFIIYWSWDSDENWIRWWRIGQPIY